MNKVLWSTLLASPAFLVATLFTAVPAIAIEAEVQLSGASTSDVLASVSLPKVAAVQVSEAAAVIAPVPAQVAQISAPVAPAPSNVDSLNQVVEYSNEGNNGLAQAGGLTIDRLSDVRPSDWAYTALQNLVEKYACIVGYPNLTYQGNRALTRYEFAAGLSSCLDRISDLIAASTADLATAEDLATLQRLQEEFAAELATLRGKVDSLEARTAELEANQFSTTTKLVGETVFSVSDIFGGGNDSTENDLGDINETTFQYRTRLNFDTSFTGRDQLRARLQAGNFNRFVTTDPATSSSLLGNEGRLGYDTGTSNALELDDLYYRFPIGDKVTARIVANAGAFNDIVNTVSPFSSSGTGALSRFGRFNPIYRAPSVNAGAATSIQFNDQITLQLGYLAGEAERSGSGAGLFNGNYGAIGQLTLTPFNRLTLGLTYINAYVQGRDSAGSSIGNNTGTGSSLARVSIGRPLSINSYGVEANFKVSSGLQVGGWAGYSHIRAIGVGDADVWNYALTVALPDLGGRGNQLGIVAGIQPRLTGADAEVGDLLSGDRRSDPDVGLHLEGFYRLRLSDNISITPGVIVLTEPNHNSNNDTAVIGVVRTTFSF
ncbi:MAG: iron uptake porin [Timaviella obliquedivisa GSE-PSE-MK23-08B]|nr:iron uptake porin [Timaviella obliquedivisa GSE-PSE-MK23-08B]